MLSISNPKRGAASADYYVNLAQEDYYANRMEEPGSWRGEGAVKLGLQGSVNAETLRHLIEGRSPDGKEELVKNVGHERRQSFWDLTFSAPKSVSVFWALAGPEVRKQVEEAHDAAVKSALQYLEENAAVSRTGKGGKKFEKAAVLFAVFLHGSSRALDPQVHTHALLFNLGIRTNGRTGAIHSRNVFRHRMAAGTLYAAVLALELRQRFGLTLRFEKAGFHIEGVPKDLCRTFSKRNTAIRKLMKERGWNTAAAAKLAALETRPPKINAKRDQLFAYWSRVALAHGWGEKEAQRLVEQGKKVNADPEGIAASFRAVNYAGSREQERTEFYKRFRKMAAEGKAKRLRRFTDAFSRRHRGRWGKVRLKKKILGVEIRIQNRNLFPNAPTWNPASKVTLPALRLGGKKRAKEKSIVWRRRFGFLELQLEKKKVFPNAPKWNGVAQIKIPKATLVLSKSKTDANTLTASQTH